jgi:tetratricopeptide (TPR) repeat protein
VITEKNQLHISTTHPASVKIWDQVADKFVELGTTPLQVSQADLKDKSQNADWIYLDISAPGYVPEHIVLPREAASSQKIRISLKQVEWWNDPSRGLGSRIVQQVGVNFQKIYRSIRQGKFDDALTQVESVIKEYPQTSILYDIRGSIYVLKGSMDSAISSYERSLQLSSDNPETSKILEQLKNKRGQ